MKMKSLNTTGLLILLGLTIVGCSKNYTNFYEDEDNGGIAIFSNNGNNLLSCYIDNNPWRTSNRSTSLFGRPEYEVYIYKTASTGIFDTLKFQWTGYYTADINASGQISLVLPVAKNFGYKNLSALAGQRLHIDTTNGFFSFYSSGLNLPGSNNANKKGSGNIYFHTASFDSIGPGSYSGTMSGLFDADFNAVKITKGRFDHSFSPNQVIFW